MITLKEWLELTEYRITEGSEFGWSCYGENAYQLDSWNGMNGEGGFSFTIIFDRVDQTVYEVQLHDFSNTRAYRMINDEFQDAEAKIRSTLSIMAWDETYYVDLELDEDFLKKATAIRSGEWYSPKVSMSLEFSDEELLLYMKCAHERDITFNEFIEDALREIISKYE